MRRNAILLIIFCIGLSYSCATDSPPPPPTYGYGRITVVNASDTSLLPSSNVDIWPATADTSNYIQGLADANAQFFFQIETEVDTHLNVWANSGTVAGDGTIHIFPNDTSSLILGCY